jgi:hypothetical protein
VIAGDTCSTAGPSPIGTGGGGDSSDVGSEHAIDAAKAVIARALAVRLEARIRGTYYRVIVIRSIQE